MKHSVVILLDFSNGYNAVWREKLLLHILNTGIPSTFIHWVQSFLNDCRERIQLFNVVSSSRRFTQGLPQGSVLTPLLFLFYINDLASLLNDNAVIAIFADGVCILTVARKRRCWSCCPISSKLCWDLDPGMEIKFQRRQKWSTSLLHLVKRQHLESYYLHWHS